MIPLLLNSERMQQVTRDHQSCVRVRLARLSRLRMRTDVGHELSCLADELSSRLVTQPVLGFARGAYRKAGLVN